MDIFIRNGDDENNSQTNATEIQVSEHLDMTQQENSVIVTKFLYHIFLNIKLSSTLKIECAIYYT